MDTLREDCDERNFDNEELLDNAEDVDLKKIRKGNTLFYVDGKNNVYDKKSFLQKFENSFVSKLKANMSVELKKTTQAFVGSIVEIMFSEFEGKKIGDEFSVDECGSALSEDIAETARKRAQVARDNPSDDSLPWSGPEFNKYPPDYIFTIKY